MFRRVGNGLGRGVGTGIKGLSFVACIVLSLMVLIFTVNVVGRYVFNRPLLGADEIIDVSMVALVFLAVGYTGFHKGHVRVDLVTSHLPKRVQSILDNIASLLGAGYWAVLGWQAAVRAWASIFQRRESTDVLDIPVTPFVLVMAVGCLILSLQLLVDFYHSVTSESDGGGK
jgi:TRAP-type transport system small permease protein